MNKSATSLAVNPQGSIGAKYSNRYVILTIWLTYNAKTKYWWSESTRLRANCICIAIQSHLLPFMPSMRHKSRILIKKYLKFLQNAPAPNCNYFRRLNIEILCIWWRKSWRNCRSALINVTFIKDEREFKCLFFDYITFLISNAYHLKSKKTASLWPWGKEGYVFWFSLRIDSAIQFSSKSL